MQVIFLVMITLLLLGDVYFLKNKEDKFIRISKEEYLVSFIVIASLLTIYMKMTGILDSAYHFIDDHEIFRMNAAIEQKGILQAAIDWMKNDMKIRFRPTYWIVRFFECFVCGTSMYRWHLFQLCIATLSFYTAYLFIRMKKCLPGLAAAFIIIVFWGEQSAVIWRLGPQENMGILFVILTLICLHNYSVKRTVLNFALLFLMTALVGGIKESFLILIPLFPCVLVIQTIKTEKVPTLKVIWEKIKKEIIYIACAALLFVAGIGIVRFRVGLLQIGYAGIDDSFKIQDYIEKIGYICRKVLWNYIVLIIIAIIIWGITEWNLRGKDKVKSQVRNLNMLLLILMFLFGIGCQLVLYAKSGMYERYLIPTTLIIGLFVISGLCYYFVSTDKKSFIVYYLYVFLFICNVVFGSDADKMAKSYAQEGKDTTALLDKIGEYKDKDPDIIVSLGGAEREISTSIYLQHKWEMSHVYNIVYSASPEGFATDGYGETEVVRIPIDEGDMYIFYADKTSEMMVEYKLEVDDFEIYKYGDFDLCVVKDFNTRQKS